MYYKSRTDLSIVQRPAVIPVMGPAGSIIVDPDFGNRIVRLTDEHSMNNSLFGLAGIGGSSDVNTCNTDTTLTFIGDNGGLGAIIGFDPATMQPKRLFPGWRPGAVIFSRLDPNVAFVLRGTQFLRFDLSDRTLNVPPTPVLVCDFAPQLPASATWGDAGGVELSDTMFTAAFSIAGGQGTGVYSCSFCIEKGFSTFNTGSGLISGDYGSTGTITLPDRFTIHNVKQSKDGAYLVIAITKHPSGTGHEPFLWQIGTTNVFPLGGDGHWTAGYNEYIDNGSSPTIPWWSHRHFPFSNMTNKLKIANPSPKMTGPLDDHISLNGPQGSMVVSFSTDTGHWTSFPGPWYDEVLGFELNGSGKVYRFCHNFCSGKSGNFYADNAIGVVDQLNKFAMWTSDWMNMLKNPNGTPRVDVFAVELR